MIYGVFFVSGFAAVIYQVIWQRVLLAMYGANVESVTVVVTAFMLGLGIGALAGGALARTTRLPLPLVFAALECGIGLYGLASLPAFEWVGGWTAGASGVASALAIFGLLALPAGLMGATLPVLVTYDVGRSETVGRAVGGLYSTNTLGSAVGALVATVAIFAPLGQRKSIWLAAGLNLLVAGVVLVWSRRARPAA
jgi:predicted membrane-bound spermidine synthase